MSRNPQLETDVELGEQMHTKTGRGFLALFVTATRMVSGLFPGSKSIINRKPGGWETSLSDNK